MASLNQSVNHEAVCTTAPATPGLLNSSMVLYLYKGLYLFMKKKIVKGPIFFLNRVYQFVLVWHLPDAV